MVDTLAGTDSNFLEELRVSISQAIDLKKATMEQALTYIDERFLEELMAYIIVSGGTMIKPETLEKMTLGEVLRLIGPNGLGLAVKEVHQPFK